MSSDTPVDHVSELRRLLRLEHPDDSAVADVSSRIVLPGRLEHGVVEVLTHEDQQILINAYPEFSLNFLNRSNHPHAFAAASRKLELKILLSKLGYSPGFSAINGFDDIICDVGGEFSYHLINGNDGVHSCNPLLDVRDCQRVTTRREALIRDVCSNKYLKTLDFNKLDVVKRFLNGDSDVVSKFYCNNAAQNCSRRARYGIALHSTYDISLQNLALIMSNKGMVELYGSFIFSDAVLLADEGFIDGINCFFKIDRIRDTIEFSFRNDSSTVYSHSFKNYMALVTLTFFKSSDNKFSFVVELLENRAGVQFFKITKISLPFPPGKLIRYLWLPSLVGKTRVTFFDLDHCEFAAGNFRKAFVKKTFFVSTEVVDKVVAHAYASTETKFRPIEIFNYLLAYNGRIFFGSDVCVRNKQLEVEQSMLLANAIYIYVYSKKYDLGKVNQFLLSAIKHDRELAEISLWGKATASKFTPPSAVVSGHSDVKIFRKLMQPFHSLLYWFKKSPYEAQEFLCSACKFVRCDVDVSHQEFSVFSSDNVFSNSCSITFPTVLDDELSLNLRSIVCDALMTNVFHNSKVVSVFDVLPRKLNVKVPFSCEFPSVVLSFLDDVVNASDFVKAVNNFSLTLPASTGACSFSNNAAVLVITDSDVGLVNLAAAACSVFVFGLDPALRPLVTSTNVTFLVADDFLSGVAMALFVGGFSSLYFSVTGEFRDAALLVTLNLLSKIDVSVFVKLLDYQLTVLLYLLMFKNNSFSVSLDVPYLNFSSKNSFGTKAVLDFVFSFSAVASGDSDSGIGLSDTSSDGSLNDSLEADEVFFPLSDDFASVSSFVSVSSSGVLESVSSVSSSSYHSFSSEPISVPAAVSNHVSNKFLKFSLLSAQQRDLVKGFCSSLDVSKATVRPGKRGRRLEWLFSPSDYSYSKVTTKPLSLFVPQIFSSMVDLSFYNTLLVVFYPESTAGLPPHQDNEPEMDSDRVLTLSSGTNAVLRISGSYSNKFELSEYDVYEILSQDGVFHAVDTLGARFALTFRKFKVPKDLLVNVPPVVVSPVSCACEVVVPNDLPDYDNLKKTYDFVQYNKTVVCRSECKLLEILSLVGDHLRGAARVLDLCASPGGWSRVLSSRGYQVTSLVYPGTSLHPSVDSTVLERDLLLNPSLGVFDVVFADGASHTGLSANIDDTLKLINAELFASHPTLTNGGFLLIKLVLHPCILNILKLLSTYNVFCVFRPFSTIVLSSEFYLFVGGGNSLVSHDFVGFYHALLHNRVFVRQLVSLVSSGAKVVVPSIPYLPAVSVPFRDFGGGGNCLFYSLSGGDYRTASDLRAYLRDNIMESSLLFGGFVKSQALDELRSDGIEAGTQSIYTFCELFKSNVKVLSAEQPEKVLLNVQHFKRPLFDVTLLYGAHHYVRVIPHVAVGNSTPVSLTLKPVDLSVVLSLFENVFGKGFLSDSSNVFFNYISNPCFLDQCDCHNGLRSLLEDVNLKNILVFLNKAHLVNKSLIPYLSSLSGFDVSFLVVPGLCKDGYLVLMLSRSQSLRSGGDLTKTFDTVVQHASVCERCDRSDINCAPFFNRALNSFFFCGEAQFVTSTSDLTGCDLVLRLVPASSTSPFCSFVRSGSEISFPVKFATAGVLSDRKTDNNKISNAFKKLFSDFGACRTMGLINCGVVNLSSFISLLRPFVSTVLCGAESSVAVSGSSLNFSPNFIPCNSDDTYIYNSMLEVREYYRTSVTNIVNSIKPLHEQYLRLVASPTFSGGDSFNNKPDYALLNLATGTFLIPPKDLGGPYSYAYDGNGLVDISSCIKPGIEQNKRFGKSTAWFKAGCMTGIVSVSKDTRLVNSQKIFSVLDKFDLQNFSLRSRLELIEGVPGCGKTNYILENHKFSLSDTSHVVLTSSREAAFDLRARVAKRFSCDVNSSMLRVRYRTVDSFLMHFSRSSYAIDVLWVDEGLMRHFGDIMWCAFISNCSTVRIIGDRAQIPFISRLSGVLLKFHLPSLSVDRMNVSFLSVTHRCPVDVAVVLNRFNVYSSHVTSSSNVERSLRVYRLKTVAEVLNVTRDAVYLTFTQDEKNTLVKSGCARVFTINEFQGNQAQHVVLIRTQTKPLDIYDSVNHILVAISRHTSTFAYYSVVTDKLSKLLGDSITQAELRDCGSLKGGGLVLGKTQTRQYPLFNVVPRAATMLDMLKQDKIIRDFVQDNGGVGVVPLRVEFSEVECSSVDLPFAPCFYVSDPVTTMQRFYDDIFPGHSLISYDYDSKIFNSDDIYFSSKELLRFSTFERFRFPYFDSLSPTLRTSCPSPVVENLKSTLKAFYDRNGCVPDLQGISDDYAVADMLFNNFVDAYVCDKELFKNFSDDPVFLNVDSIEDWLFTQPSNIKSLAFSDELNNIFMHELNKYSMILKRLPKPKLQNDACFKFPSPQTIAHSSKDVNAVFCPIIREIKRRIVSVIPNNVILFSDMSIDDFENIMTLRLPAERLKFLQFMLESDISKYDKSQNRVTLLFEVRILLAFGFPRELITTWIFMHVYSQLYSRLTGMVARVFFQRKSGDPMTYLGNTVFLMAVFASSDISGFSSRVRAGNLFCLFSGDDLLIFSSDPIDTSFVTHELAVRFNLESKVLNFQTAYFCSKFLFMTPWGRWVMVPDVVKMLTKLGRRDLVNFQHVEEYRISCADVGKHLSNSVLYPFIDDCLRDRYHLDLKNFSSLYSAMATCFSSRDLFSKLYFVRDSALIDTERYLVRINDF